jgi:protein-S-isoprenylcysteine O-methyltransferase Ste14
MALLIKNLLFTLIVPGTVGVYLPLTIAAGSEPATGVVFAIAAAVLAAGGSIYAWCVWDFATFGRGTPAPIDAPKKLVERGLYAYTRNPMYVGVLTVILGWTILYRVLPLAGYMAVVGACFHAFTVLYEEPHLRGEFGRQYDDYCARVGRWLPRFGAN